MSKTSCVLLVLLLAVYSEAVTVSFSKGIGNGMVLQRQPAHSSLYGSAPPGAKVVLTLTNEDAALETESLAVVAAADGSWKATLAPRNAGGNFSATASVTSAGPSGTATITDLTFGDVWFCSGQSNMELSLSFTFSRNLTVAKILEGHYSNVRVYLNPHVTMPQPMWVDDGTHVAARSKASGPLEYRWRHVRDVVNGSDVQVLGK